MIRRVLRFDKKDRQHVWWLFRNMIKQFVLWNFDDSKEAWFFLKLHLTHDHKRMN